MKLALIVVLLAATGCPGPSPAADAQPDCDVVLEWGRRVNGDFVPFESGDEAEITLGFQGFRYIWSAARIVDTDATDAVFDFQIEVTGHAPYSQTGVATPTTIAPGGRYADELLVFFNDIPMPEILGRNTTITARTTAAGCRGTTSTAVTLVDRDDCIDAQDGGLGCMGTDAGL